MSDRVREAVEFIKAGNKEEGRKILIEVLTENEKNEAAWLWLSATVDTSDLRRECLEEVLKINPNNQSAIKALARLPKEEAKPQAAQQEPAPSPDRPKEYIPEGLEPAYLTETYYVE